MKKFLGMALFMCLYWASYASVNCGAATLIQATSNTLELHVPSSTACPGSEDVRVSVRANGTGGYTSKTVSVTNNANGRTFVINGLAACTPYEVRMIVLCGTSFRGICYQTYSTSCVSYGDCSDVFVNNIGENSASLQLASGAFPDCRLNNNLLNYELSWRVAGGSYNTPLSLNSAGTPLFSWFGNLQACTEYEYRVRFECGGSYGAWCTGTFTTDCPPEVEVNNVGNTTATIEWDGFEDCRTGTNGPNNQGQIAFQVVIFEQGTSPPPYPTLVTADNVFNATGLTPCTTYDYWIRFECDGDWTQWYMGSFTTTGTNCRIAPGQNEPGAGEGQVQEGIVGKRSLDTKAIEVSAFPNPFNNEAQLRFSLLTSETVSIEVHDLMGRSLYRYEGRFEAGTHEHKLAGNNLPSGVLFYTLTSGEQKVSERIVKH